MKERRRHAWDKLPKVKNSDIRTLCGGQSGARNEEEKIKWNIQRPRNGLCPHCGFLKNFLTEALLIKKKNS